MGIRKLIGNGVVRGELEEAMREVTMRGRSGTIQGFSGLDYLKRVPMIRFGERIDRLLVGHILIRSPTNLQVSAIH